ncbi:MAG: PH domain-containing protein [Chloroflexota bacterium]
MAEYVETLLAPGETIVTNARQHWAALIRFALTPIIILALGFLGIIVGSWFGGGSGLFGSIGDLLDTIIGLLTGLAFVVAVIWLPIQFIRWGSRRYVLTSRRVLTSDGWLRKTTSDASLDKITDVDYSQSFVGSRMGFGDLVIQTASNTPLKMPEIRDAIEFKKAIMVAQEDMVKSRAATLLAAQGVPVAPVVAAAAAAAPAAPAGGIPGASVPMQPGIPGSSVPRQPGVPGSGAPVPPPPPLPVANAAPAAAAPAPVAMTPTEITATLASLTDMKEAGTITEADYEAKKKELLDRL